MVFCYLTAIIMIVIGSVFFTGKAASYIKGYQMTPEDEKKNIDIKALCRNISAMFFIAAAIFALAGFSELFRTAYFRWAMVGWLVLGCADVLYLNKSKRFVTEAAPTRK